MMIWPGAPPPDPAARARRDRREQWREALEPIPTVVHWYMGHIPAGTLLLGAFLVVKAYVLSKGSIPIALGILQTAGLTNVVVGGLLSALPILAAAMLAVSADRTVKTWAWREADAAGRGAAGGGPPASGAAGAGPRRDLAAPGLMAPGHTAPDLRSTVASAAERVADLRWESLAAYFRDSFPTRAVVTAGAIVLSALLTPWTFMLGAIVTGGLQGLIERWRAAGPRDTQPGPGWEPRDTQPGPGWEPPDTQPGPGTQPGGAATGRTAAATVRLAVAAVLLRVAIAGFAVYAVFSMLYTVWLPHESVALASGPQPRREVGYVLADDPDGWITILRTGEHRIVLYRDSAVKSRVLCQKVSSGFFARVTDATTLWDNVTKEVPPLQFLHPAVLSPCKRGRYGPPPQNGSSGSPNS